MAAMQHMKLNIVDRERITDCLVKVQSIRKSLPHVTKGVIPERHAIQECLDAADRHLRSALGYARLRHPPPGERESPTAAE